MRCVRTAASIARVKHLEAMDDEWIETGQPGYL
jgi:hypothetical protein